MEFTHVIIEIKPLYIEEIPLSVQMTRAAAWEEQCSSGSLNTENRWERDGPRNKQFSTL